METVGIPAKKETIPTPQLSVVETQSAYILQLKEVPELATYGEVLGSSKPVQLTESETEYQVTCVKHTFEEHIVFQVCGDLSPIRWMALTAIQFNVSNTMPDTILEQVAVVMQPSAEASVTEDFIIPLSSLSSVTSPGIVYVSFTRDSPEEYVSGSFQCVLKFVSKEVDPSTGDPEEEGYEDEYHLEGVELGAGDYIIPTYVTFSSEWDRLRGGASATETFSLSAMEGLKGSFMPLVLCCF